MKKRVFSAVALGVLLAASAPAQSTPLPQTYSFTATSTMMAPTTLTVNRNGSKELIEVAGSDMHMRVLYDFQAHRIYTVDLSAKTCTTQQYESAWAPVLWDPIGGAAEMGKEAGSLTTISRQAVNGVATRLVESPIKEGPGGKYRVWLEEKYGFAVKQAVILGKNPERVLFEMQKISYAPSAATLFTAPAQCTQIGGVSTATGGRAEMTVGASVQGEAAMGGGAAGKPAVQAGDPNRLVGKWEFTGKDGAGTDWRGTLTVEKLEPNSWDPSKYSNVCDLSVSSAKSGKGMSNACLYDHRTKTLTFAGGDGSRQYSLTATLSPDGKSLIQGRWTEGGKNGVWSAKR